MPEVTTLTDFGAFVNEAQFAKVVIGPGNEEMLLVNGKVYRVIGPEGPCADLFARALRQMTPTDSLRMAQGATLGASRHTLAADLQNTITVASMPPIGWKDGVPLDPHSAG